MNESAKEDGVNHLDARRQAVFYVGLSQRLLPVLEQSENYGYAVRAINLCWQWIERRSVAGQVLFYLYHDEEDHGVEPAMYAEYSRDTVMWNVWGCVSLALIYTAFCAYESEGGPLPETLELADSDTTSKAFVEYLRGAHQDSRVLNLFSDYLGKFPDDHLKESIIASKLDRLFSDEA